MIRTTARTARRFYWCGGERYGHRQIKPGERYIEHVISPDHDDIGNSGWDRAQECAECATRYGRGDLLARSPENDEPPGDCALAGLRGVLACANNGDPGKRGPG